VHAPNTVDAFNVVLVEPLVKEFFPMGLLSIFQAALLIPDHLGHFRVVTQVIVKPGQYSIDIFFNHRPKCAETGYNLIINARKLQPALKTFGSI